MSHDLTQRVLFDQIRYANCWEDADLLLAGLAPAPGSTILSVGSAGDNSFSLLSTQPARVVAVDISALQLYLIELKKASIQTLSRAQTLEFLGFTESTRREEYFQAIKTALSTPARQYWENNRPLLRGGVIHQGKFERYFQLFAHKLLPWIHSGRTIDELLRPKSEAEQATYYASRWDTWRWKLLFRLFFSRYVMGKYGRDPEFLREVKVPVAKTIYAKAARHLQSAAAQTNPMLRYALTGSFGTLVPHYLRPENYDAIKANLDRLVLKQGFAQEAIAEFGPFGYLNLSNIFEYMDQRQFMDTAQQLLEGTLPGGKLAYWNLLVPRHIAPARPESARYLAALSSTLTARDNGFFYQQFIVDQRK
ncbi:hypothetical protein GCM10027275_04200 [Rhabdobacter roseus]|uniref:S-adenosylmethionine-diacylglycerol 3-amino-3-carboxypropyl transferase n=1 Tax=Rhabdobacter roseus TaxID=1655419 RepID=A0A840TQI6_9BACT|nr:DUF3419 family protein [Rhabdobacter roseus]MBB5282310.1 S-adenosylmethionine-diacylglycerol 3-amino-3-carboxypropyl transferase [Rhabdobacter roseus]